jgi:hypothetical protein
MDGQAGAPAEPTGGTTATGGTVGVGGESEATGGDSPSAGGAGGDPGTSQSGAGGALTGGAGGEGGEEVTKSGDFPELLSETGLYADIAKDEIAESALEYHPAHELWSDGAEKRRWVVLPDDARIDTSEMDYWKYPVGTRFFKEFSVEGRRVETRLLQKSTKGWTAIAYVWNDDATEAVAAPDGERSVLGTEHDVPKQSDCKTCHDKMQDFVLGFTALQLSHDEGGVTLDSLIAADRISDAPAAPLVVPGDDTTRAALGYLHANCGTCHNDRSFVMSRTPISFWLTADALGSLEDTPAYKTAVDKPTGLDGEHALVIAPGAPEESEIIARMKQRGTEEQMPPVASKRVDPDGVALIEAFIANLPVE